MSFEVGCRTYASTFHNNIGANERFASYFACHSANQLSGDPGKGYLDCKTKNKNFANRGKSIMIRHQIGQIMAVNVLL